MKRFFLTLVTVAILIIGLSPLTARADVNNFSITSFKADYYLDKDREGRSTLKTVERITANFPNPNQNRGLERALPKQYDGHTTNLKVVSVKNEAGGAVEYKEINQGDSLVLRIGNPNAYVEGTQVYEITYTQADVTRYFSDTKSDEFYWDINGTQWKQPFGNVEATVHFGSNLTASLNGNMSCYYGPQGATNKCQIVRDGETVVATQSSLAAGENMTIAIGFKQGTFVAYQKTWQENLFALWMSTIVITSTIGIGLITWVSIRWNNLKNRKKEMGTIVPEYLPPKGYSVLAAAKVGSQVVNTTTAQLIDLAVRRYLKLYQTQEKSTFKSAEYEIEIVKAIDDLSAEERAFLNTLFDGQVEVGTRLRMRDLSKRRSQLYKDTVAYNKVLDKATRSEYGLFEKIARRSRWFTILGWIVLAVGIMTLSFLLIMAAVISFILGATLWILTDKGLALRRYLEGLKLYIKVAEKERLQMLQSPEGTEKVGQKIGDNDTVQLVKLYERVLPYAVLFGQEKEWNKQLGQYYDASGTQPDWYVGQTAFNAVLFSSAMSSFSQATNSYANSTSSSSGGSTGGGYSGGGGGGGGGGGW